MINVARLHDELQVAGIPIHGCASTGRVDFMDVATDEQRALAARIVAVHDPRMTYAEMRAKEYPPTGELIVALWELVVEKRPEYSIVLQAKREEIKLKYPKPGAA